MVTYNILKTDPLSIEVNFDEPEAKGKVLLHAGPYGLVVKSGDECNPTVLVDLFYASDEGRVVSRPLDMQVLIYDGHEGDEIARAYQEKGRVVVQLDEYAEPFARNRFAIEDPED